MGKHRTADETPARRGLLGALLRAVGFAFALFLAYSFLAEVAAVALSLAVGALLAAPTPAARRWWTSCSRSWTAL